MTLNYEKYFKKDYQKLLEKYFYKIILLYVNFF